MSGAALSLLAALAALAAAGALGAWLAGAPAGAAVAAALGAGIALALGRIAFRRVLADPAKRVRTLADDLAAGRLGARLPGTWTGALRPIAEALNRMADTLERRFRASDAQRARLAAVIEAMEEAVLVVDADERVQLANPRLRDLVPSPAAAGPLEGRALLEAVRHSEVVDALRAALRKGEAQHREIVVGPAPERHVRLHAAPVSQPDGSTGAVAVLHDVTDLRRIDRVRRDFVANASHELKTPLTSIRGFAERLSEAALDPPAKRAVEVILANARRLGALVDDLLELSRIESGGAPPVPEALSPADVARRLLDELEPRLRAGGLAAAVEVEAPARVWADPRALEQVLANLLDNAVKYTPPGGRVTVRVREGAGERAIVEVEDTGIGIPRKDLPRIFERFYRVDPGRSRALGGTGLGLSIVKHLVQAMGGHVGVESQAGNGSRFWIELPRHAPAPPRS